MKTSHLYPVLVLGCFAAGVSAQQAWTVHDVNRPNPSVVSPSEKLGGAPSDATVLFDGHDLNAFQDLHGEPAKWQLGDGYFTVTPRSGSIRTRQQFGDCQLHVEWASPSPPQGEDQMRGNSGVIMMGLFEIQVLDSFKSRTYADGQAAAIYGQYPPLVNASRGPGEWQTYDVIFHRPRFDDSGRLLHPASVTLMQNGVLVQDHVQLSGPTAFHNRPPYIPVEEHLPIVLQDHGTPVRYRNIWIRELAEEPAPLPVKAAVPLRAEAVQFASYAGAYQGGTMSLEVSSSSDKIIAQMGGRSNRGEIRPPVQLMPISDDTFIARGLPGSDLIQIFFTRDAASRGEKGAVTGAVIFSADKYTNLMRK